MIGDISKILPERSWQVLELRAGFQKRATLAEVGAQIGVTRERVRQIQGLAVMKLRKDLISLVSFLEENSNELWDPMDQQCTPRTAAARVHILAVGSEYDINSIEDALRVFVGVRSLVCFSDDDFIHPWPNTTYAICGLKPAIQDHPRVAAAIAEEDRKWTYKELAVLVLTEAQEPLHWREIVARAEALGVRDDIVATPMFNAILGADDLFARVSAGTYGLTEWGLSDSPYYTDLIASVLSRAEAPLVLGALFHAVNEIRPIKRSSLMMFLELHPRFYRSIESTYGLRSWLPPRHKQTLRTSRSLVEDEKSWLRLQRAAARGYDVQGYL